MKQEPKALIPGPDFEVMYRNEHLKALKLEVQLLDVRFGQCQTEIAGIEIKCGDSK